MSRAADLSWLTKLHDIVEPPAPALWPPAPGWWLVAALVLLLLVRGGQWAWQRWQANAYRRVALRALARSEHAETAERVATCVRLLRHAGLALTAHDAGAQASGAAWVVWLQSRCPNLTPSARVQQLLSDGAYCPPQRLSPDDATELHAFTRRWLQEHRA